MNPHKLQPYHKIYINHQGCNHKFLSKEEEDRPFGSVIYCTERFVNGEPFSITNICNKDTPENRELFEKTANMAFDRARAAPFN